MRGVAPWEVDTIIKYSGKLISIPPFLLGEEDDPIVDKSQIIALYNQDQRINVEYPDMQREVTPEIIQHITSTNKGYGIIVYSQLHETNADPVIYEQLEYFESHGQGFEWKLYDYDPPPDLKNRLGAHGFELEKAEAIMVLDMNVTPAFFWEPVTYDIARLTDRKNLLNVLTIQQ